MEFLKYVLSNGSRVHLIDGKFAEPLGITNPSIIKHNGKLMMNVRTCEYTFFNYKKNNPNNNLGLSWYPLNIGSNLPANYYSRNHLCKFNDSFDLENVTELFPKQFERKLVYNGAEDIRLAESENGNMLLSYSTLDADNSISMNIVELNDSLETKSSYKYSDHSCEKNWMPILDKPGHYVRMAFGDIVELKDTSFIHHGDANAPLEYRGSSQMVPYKDTYICLVHKGDVYADSNGVYKLSYKHMFIQTDKNYNIIAKSRWFTFCGMPIEFTCGMMIEDNKVIIPFSIFDSITLVLETDIDLILKFINDSFSINNGYVPAYDEFHDIVLRKNGLDAILSLDKYFISRYPNNAAIRIACLTHIGSYEKNKNAAIDYYVRALCEVKKFTTGMYNNYMHALIGQDLLRDTINDLLYC